MLRITVLPILILAVAALSTRPACAAQDSPTVDSILARAIEASGGKAALEKIKTRTIKAELEMPAISIKGPWALAAKAPNKQVSHFEMAGAGTVVEGFDGKVAWSKGPTGVREKTGEELAKMKRDADFYRELNLKKLYPDLAYKGSEQFDGQEVDVLESRPSSTSKERFSFSKKTGLLVRQQSEFENPQGKIELDLRLLDYKSYDGIQFPRKLSGRASSGGQEMGFDINVTEIRHNEPMDDAKFAKPDA